MPIPFHEADYIFRSSKRLLRPLTWDERVGQRKNDTRTCLEARVEIAGAVPRGVFFRIVSHPGSLARVTFQLEVERDRSRRLPDRTRTSFMVATTLTGCSLTLAFLMSMYFTTASSLTGNCELARMNKRELLRIRRKILLPLSRMFVVESIS